MIDLRRPEVSREREEISEENSYIQLRQPFVEHDLPESESMLIAKTSVLKLVGSLSVNATGFSFLIRDTALS